MVLNRMPCGFRFQERFPDAHDLGVKIDIRPLQGQKHAAADAGIPGDDHARVDCVTRRLGAQFVALIPRENDDVFIVDFQGAFLSRDVLNNEAVTSSISKGF